MSAAKVGSHQVAFLGFYDGRGMGLGEESVVIEEFILQDGR